MEGRHSNQQTQTRQQGNQEKTMKDNTALMNNLLTMKKKQFEVHFELEKTNYDPIEKIGTGAYGVVCSAKHKITNDSVAIKKIPRIFDNEHLSKRTYREIKILKHFKHDNVISIREILKPREPISEFKDVYIVLDLMESDLHNIIHSTQELSDEHVRYFLYQILRGLKYIHSANIIHRDLKPGNLLINENCDLKIGDFGMARAISSNEEEHKYFMTQYVATRWYRAPEIMLSLVEYTTAIDMWSVGCIFAEMLGRKPLFPGKDWINQLKLIVGIVGMPSREVLKMSKSDIVKNFIRGLGKKTPVNLKCLFPRAPSQAIDLLERMLDLNPKKRITVQQALAHPYLSKYHDPDDEPICFPVFDFDFEKQMDNTNLKDAIMKEIMDFHKPKTPDLMGFNLRLVPKASESEDAVVPTSASTDLDAFLQSLQQKLSDRTTSPPSDQIEATSVTEHYTQPPGVQRGNNSLPSEPWIQAPNQSFIQQTIQAAAKDNQKVNAVAPFTNVDLTSSNVYTMPPGGDILQHLESRIQSTVTVDTSNKLSVTTSDIDMPSAKLSPTDQSKGAQNVECVEMLSAGLTQKKVAVVAPMATSTTTSDASKDKQQEKPVDAKALIKQAILNAEFRKQRQDSNGEEVKSKAVTAVQRQREREQKRKKKMEKQMERLKKEKQKKKNENQNPSSLLSDEDKQMLERWKTMQETTKPFVHPIRHHLKEIIELKKETAVPSKSLLNCDKSGNSNQNSVNVNQNNSETKPTEDQTVPGLAISSTPSLSSSQQTVVSQNTLLHPSVKFQPDSFSETLTVNTNISTTCPESVKMSTKPIQSASPHQDPLMSSGEILQNLEDFYNQTEPLQGHSDFYENKPQNEFYSIPNNMLQFDPAKASEQNRTQPNQLSFLGNLSDDTETRATIIQDSAAGRQHIQLAGEQGQMLPSDIPSWTTIQTDMNLPNVHTNVTERLPTYTEAMQAKVHTVPQNPSGTVSDITGVGFNTSAMEHGQYFQNSQASITVCEASRSQLPNMDANLPKLVIPPRVPMSQELLAQLPLHENADSDLVAMVTKQLSRSQVVDPLPPVLVRTPRGTGAGYGVGLDVEALMREMDSSNRTDMVKPDSAPLSASLLADWLEVSGCRDTQDLEALQQELEMGSPMVFPN